MKPSLELNKLVAEKVMGWTEVAESKTPHMGVILQGIAPDTRPSQFTGYIQRDIVPDYSEKIEAAWLVIEKLCSSFYLRWDDSDCSWEVSLDQKRRIAEDCRGSGYAGSAPYAICLAALKAVGVDTVETEGRADD